MYRVIKFKYKYIMATVNLGIANTFAIIAYAGITNTGNSVVNGNTDVFPNTFTSYSGLLNYNLPSGGQSPGIITGTAYYSGSEPDNDDPASVSDAANDAKDSCDQPATLQIPAIINGSLTLTEAGVYSIVGGVADLTINGTLIINAVTNSQFIFQVPGILTFGPGSQIIPSNGITSSTIFWNVGANTVLNTASKSVGNILSTYGISLADSASSNGLLYSITGSVTLINNIISSQVICYVKGTRILTKDGYKNIEDIIVGDDVRVYAKIKDGEVTNRITDESTLKVTFNGYFTISYFNNENIPVTFEAGSLEQNIPSEKVSLSPWHKVLFNNKLFLAENLINNKTIYQSKDHESVTYYHIELEEHSIINAGGLFGETLLGNHHLFTSI